MIARIRDTRINTSFDASVLKGLRRTRRPRQSLRVDLDDFYRVVAQSLGGMKKRRKGRSKALAAQLVANCPRSTWRRAIHWRSLRSTPIRVSAGPKNAASKKLPRARPTLRSASQWATDYSVLTPPSLCTCLRAIRAGCRVDRVGIAPRMASQKLIPWDDGCWSSMVQVRTVCSPCATTSNSRRGFVHPSGRGSRSSLTF